jgi:rhodanese-related sulfurtransferase
MYLEIARGKTSLIDVRRDTNLSIRKYIGSFRNVNVPYSDIQCRINLDNLDTLQDFGANPLST